MIVTCHPITPQLFVSHILNKFHFYLYSWRTHKVICKGNPPVFGRFPSIRASECGVFYLLLAWSSQQWIQRLASVKWQSHLNSHVSTSILVPSFQGTAKFMACDLQMSYHDFEPTCYWFWKNTENWELSQYQLCLHWWYCRSLSWQTTVSPMLTNLALWELSVVNESTTYLIKYAYSR